MNLSNNKILITGGATGIGLGLTQRFIEENNTVIICGRRESVLNEVKAQFPAVLTKVCDLSVEAERVALYEWINENHSDLNVLINNAGIQKWVSVTDADFYESAKAEINTNIEAPLHLTSLFMNLKSLTTVMNVTSGLAFSPFAKIPVYSATKAFFRSFTLSLRHILKSKNIEVIEIIPPALNTNLGGTGLHDAHPSVSSFIESIFEQLKDGRSELTFGTSETRLNASAEDLRNHFNAMHSN
ncbi:SDR family NAD(P)-dependent oxidoreductase [Flavobacterium circumlabens]|uniref:Oxidoreductase n=1 Tax=Flavobacterium circumlabens TaxID=2133765 RepID=A0A4Y7U8L6_9FLAO|nr:SDR family NAD(P)-dependent oxidoreductase [Flavobacterium circumlabens]TCN54570.1 putative oxidoreductase [Flavobacterium circumlabens]TEB42770.1 SDR family NAD(P)-dependent oxidoreductase [Flavobacterium circumlabens]